MKRLYLLFLFALLIIPVVSAVPPVQTSTINNGIQISYPKYDILPVNQSFMLDIHVINDSMQLTNSTNNCFVHLYSPNGNHILTGNFIYDTADTDYDINLPPSNFSTLGVHAFYIQCNTTGQVGFASGTFFVTNTGVERTTDGAITYSTEIFVLLVLFILMLWGTLSIEWTSSRNDDHVLSMSYFKYLKIPLGIGAYTVLTLLFYLAWGFSYNYLNINLASGIFQVLTYIMLTGMLILFPGVIIVAVVDYLNGLRMSKLLQRGLLPR